MQTLLRGGRAPLFWVQVWNSYYKTDNDQNESEQQGCFTKNHIVSNKMVFGLLVFRAQLL